MTLTIDYTDKTVVVIGGTSGINRGIAETSLPPRPWFP